MRGSNAGAVLARLNPIIRGWAAYYRGAVSSRIFSRLDDLRVEAHLQVGQTQPPEQVEDLGGLPATSASSTSSGTTGGCSATAPRQRRGDVAHLIKFSWTNIVRHQTVNGTASPDDPALTEYWAARRRRIKPPLDRYTLRLLDQAGQPLPALRGSLLTADQPPGSPSQWENWWLLVTRKAIQHDYLVHHGRPDDPAARTVTKPAWYTLPAERALRARQRRSTAPRPWPP